MAIIQTELFSPRQSRRPRVLAVFSYRYDAHLVPDLIKNLTPAIDGFVACDDRDAMAGLSSEPERRVALLQAARDAGAAWILAADPDERFEDALRDRIGTFVAGGRDVLWTFALREMLSAETYRSDGIWGGKTQMRLFSLDAVANDRLRALNGPWVAARKGLDTRATGLSIYHFRSATPERRQHRRDTYAAADPERRYQDIGYDYLADERGMVEEAVPRQHRYSPRFEEDGGLWAPPITHIGTPVADPVAAQLRLISLLLGSRGWCSAAQIAGDLARRSPRDTDIAFLAQVLDANSAPALNTQLPYDSPSVGRMHEPPPTLPEQGWLAHATRCKRDSMSGCFEGENVAWRDHISGPARINDGDQVASSDLALIVLSYRAPHELRRAVASLLTQSPVPEVVVVNSGGGQSDAVLAEFLPSIRLINVQERLFVGAARNVGIDASRAPFVGFLAADCIALPGWVAARIERHRSGALSVSTPVLTTRPGDLINLATNLYSYGRRHPSTAPIEAHHFGRSYHRSLFGRLGYFPPGLRESEDEVFNHAVDRIELPVWAPEILTGHSDPDGLGASLKDRFVRGFRMALGPNEPRGGVADRPFNLLQQRQIERLRVANGLIEARPGLSLHDRQRLRRLARGLAASEAAGYRIGKLRIRFARVIDILSAKTGTAAFRTVASGWVSRLSPQNWHYHLLHAQNLLSTGAAEEAIQQLETAAALAPLEAAPLRLLCDRLVNMGRPDEAQARVERAVMYAPGVAGLRRLAAEMARSRGQKDMALLHARFGLAANPADPELHDLLAQLHADAERRGQADLRQAMAAHLREFSSKLITG